MPSDRTEQLLANLTYEVTQLAADHLIFSKRLHQLNSDLITDKDVQVQEQRLVRLRGMLNGLQRQSKD